MLWAHKRKAAVSTLSSHPTGWHTACGLVWSSFFVTDKFSSANSTGLSGTMCREREVMNVSIPHVQAVLCCCDANVKGSMGGTFPPHGEILLFEDSQIKMSLL